MALQQALKTCEMQMVGGSAGPARKRRKKRKAEAAPPEFDLQDIPGKERKVGSFGGVVLGFVGLNV